MLKRFIEVADRTQVTLLPECLNDYIAEDNPVRVVDAYVEELDLKSSALKVRSRQQPAGRRTTPAVLREIYIDGYLNRVQCSGRLKREAQRTVELMWQTGRLAPDFKTIANFRGDNGEGIRNVCQRFTSRERTVLRRSPRLAGLAPWNAGGLSERPLQTD